MERKRRVTIEFERREVTMTIRHTADVAAGTESQETAPGGTSKICLICGCHQLLPLADSMAKYSGRQLDLSEALTTGELHLASVGNELWLCERSFERFKETRQ